MSEERRRTCHACRSRKIRCDGQQTCRHCAHSGLQCVYQLGSPSSQSRRSIVRGGVIRNIKQHQSLGLEQHPTALQCPPAALSAPESFVDLAEDYGTIVVPHYPVFTKSDFLLAIQASKSSVSDEALVHSLAAITINMACRDTTEESSRGSRVTALYLRALALRGPAMPNKSFTISSIIISDITATCLLAVNHDVEMGLYYLRDAISQIGTLRVEDLIEQNVLKESELARLERIYWLLFIHERYAALTFFRSVTMAPLSKLPRPDPSMTLEMSFGYSQLITLFTSVDFLFIRHWLDRESPTMTVTWIESKQRELSDKPEWDEQLKGLSDFQLVDLHINRYWFRTLVWQMALSKQFLASYTIGQQEALSMFFPIEISHHIQLLLQKTPLQALEIHGPGLLQKVFDVAATTADVLVIALVPIQDHEHILQHLRNFVVLYHFLMSMPRFEQMEREILNRKFEQLQSLYPSLREDTTSQASAE